MADPVAEAPAPPRDAATIILLRRSAKGASVLMGLRGANAAFMPSKYVFPGGGLDAADASVPLVTPLGQTCAARIDQRAAPGLAPALAAAAVRELWEETGLLLAEPATVALPDGWAPFATQGLAPTARDLRFFFRAITPPGRSRRFDARFFLADAGAIIGDPDDFSGASDELSHLHWVPLPEARQLNLPFITEVVLAEIMAHVANLPADAPLGTPDGVPFFDNSGPVPCFRRIY
ncbi:MAG: NUDIX hydrolase [Paracoccaceae bacterium]